MKKIFLLISLITFLGFHTFAQEVSSQNEFQSLLAQLSANSTLDELDEAISKATSIFKDEKKEAGKNQRKLADVTIEFISFRKKVSLMLKEKTENLGSFDIKNADFYKKRDNLSANTGEIVKLYEEVIELYQSNLNWEDIRLAEIKFELALLLNIYEPLVADINTPSGKRLLTWKEKRERLSKSQDLFSQALIIQEKLLPVNDIATLITNLFLAVAYLQSADFEKSLPLIEKYISGIETKYGKKTESLLPALRIHTVIMLLIGNNNSATEISKQIFEITGKEENLANNLLFLTPRTKTFKYKGITGEDRIEVLDIQSYARVNANGNLPTPAGIISRGGSVNLISVDSIVIPFMDGNIKGLTKVIIVIDENGKVIEAEPQTKDQKSKKKIEKDVLSWEFRPFNYNNERKKMKGIVYFFEK